MERDTKPQEKTDSQSRLLDDLYWEIKDHEKHDSQKSVLGSVVGAVWSKDDKSLSELKTLYDDAAAKEKRGDTSGIAAMESQIRQAIKDDKSNVGTKDEITRYGTGFLKTVPMFMSG